MQVLSLANFETLHSGSLNFPEHGNWDDENFTFDRLQTQTRNDYYGNALLEIRAPKAKPLSIPIPETHGNKLRRLRGHRWTCSFSVCSRYILIVYNPRGTGQDQAGLFLFSFDMQGKTCARLLEDIYIAQYHGLTVDLHTDRPEMVPNVWTLGDLVVGSLSPYSTGGDNTMDVATILLDLEERKLDHPGSPKKAWKA